MLTNLSNKTYDRLKALVTIVSPAAITLYATLATLWEWSNTDKITASAGAVTLFVGVILKISSARFDADPNIIVLDPNNPAGPPIL